MSAHRPPDNRQPDHPPTKPIAKGASLDSPPPRRRRTLRLNQSPKVPTSPFRLSHFGRPLSPTTPSNFGKWSSKRRARTQHRRCACSWATSSSVSKDNDRALLQVSDEMRPAAESAEQDLCTLLSAAWGEPVRVVIEGSIPSPRPPGGRAGEGWDSSPAPASAPTDTTPRTPDRGPPAHQAGHRTL